MEKIIKRLEQIPKDYERTFKEVIDQEYSGDIKLFERNLELNEVIE